MVAKIEESFKCQYCGQIQKITDYDWKDRNLYYSLRDARICEECARAGKSFHGKCEK